MANPINPLNRKTQPVVKPVDVVKQGELKKRATGVPLPQPPKPSKPLPAGVTGTPPLPAGRPVVQTAPSSLTAIERATLEASGWTDEIGLPTTHEGMKEIQDAVSRMNAVEVPLPKSPQQFKPPTAVPIESLSKEAQADVLGAVDNAFKHIVDNDQKRATSAAGSTIPGMAKASSVMQQSMEAFKNRLQNEQTHEVEVKPDAAPVVEQVPVPVPVPAAPAPVAVTPRSETGADATLSHCPHCRWDLSLPDVMEPEYSDKMSFVHTMLGQKDFSKVYNLFNGTISVKFRTLTTYEIDTIQRQTYQDRISGRISEEQLDFYERMNRYRMCLQLIDFSSRDGSVAQPLPDGYSKDTNPHSADQWLSPTQQSELSINTPNETALPQIETWLIENVLKSEALYRIVVHTCHQFNRMVAKLEAMADHSDFWNPTEAQS